MPRCACFHSFEMNWPDPQTCELSVKLEGYDLLSGILARSGIAQSLTPVREVPNSGGWMDLSSFEHWKEIKFSLEGVLAQREEVENFLRILQNRVLIDLEMLDECYAISPYTVFDKEDRAARTAVGNLVNQIKYWGMPIPARVSENMHTFIRHHPGFRGVTSICAPPGSSAAGPNIALHTARQLLESMDVPLVEVTKIRPGPPQKELPDDMDEFSASGRIRGTMQLESGRVRGGRVLVIDDTIRSGGTLIEVARVLKEAGAAAVYGLALAKDAKFTQGGLNLSNEVWR